MLPPGSGPGDIPFDRSAEDPLAQLTPAMGGDISAAAAPPVQDAPTGILANVANAGDFNTDQLTGEQLAQLGVGDMAAPEPVDPSDMAFEEMQAALTDPNTPPEIRRRIEQQLAMAARDAMLGGG